jgi:poly(3-hydroxybutyrate) depolymerase
MASVRISVFVVLVLVVTVQAYGSWQADLDRLIRMEVGPEQEALLAKIVRLEPDWHEVAQRIRATGFPAPTRTGTLLDSTECLDGITRPWVLYVPSGYDPGVPTPMIVWLHGGVGRANIIDDPLGYIEEDRFRALAEEKAWLVLYPFGQHGATWWDRVGMANISHLVRTVKRDYNVDDDRVWMEGFSDGGSACFAHAMVAPTDYAAFVALNGHIGVGSLSGDLPLYAPNLVNSPLYVITTREDPLYPSHKMRRTIERARSAGADILYREYGGGHAFVYADQEMPLIARFFTRHPRDPLPHSITWEAGDPRYGQCRWFKIEEISTEEAAAWHGDYNTALVDDRITIGFVNDDAFEEGGVKIGTVVEQSAAEAMGLLPGDIITGAGDMAVDTIDDIYEFKATLKRGDAFSLEVKREGQEILLTGQIPEPGTYYVFKREKPSGIARVSSSANHIEVETSRVAAFKIFIHPDIVSLDDNLVVTWNGEVVYDAKVEGDIEFLLRNFLLNRDRMLLYAAGLYFETAGDRPPASQ